MALFEACDRLITLRAENQALKTELTYYKNRAALEDERHKPDYKPTPMEELANKVNSGLFTNLKKNDKDKKD